MRVCRANKVDYKLFQSAHLRTKQARMNGRSHTDRVSFTAMCASKLQDGLANFVMYLPQKN